MTYNQRQTHWPDVFIESTGRGIVAIWVVSVARTGDMSISTFATAIILFAWAVMPIVAYEGVMAGEE